MLVYSSFTAYSSKLTTHATMTRWVVAVLCVHLLIVPLVEGKEVTMGLSEVRNCSGWTVYNSSTSECVCGNSLYYTVLCHNQYPNISLSLKNCYCMSYYNSTEVVSNCPFSCGTFHSGSPNYYRQVMITAAGDDVICGDYKRRGPMCGLCEQNHAPPVYHYNFTCVECSNYKLNWLKYIAIAYLPLTVFYFLVLTLKISATAGSWNGLITIIQLAAAPGVVRFYLLPHHRWSIIIKLITGMSTILNLDFFKSFYSPFCLHPSMTTIQVFALDYLLGVYPLLLIILTFIIVKLHDQYALVVFLWRPCYTLFSRFSSKLNIKTSLVQAFATFILLSYVKIMNTSFDILTPSNNYGKPDGNLVGKLFWYYNGSLEYFGKEHIPYAALAIIMSFTFNFLPLALLILYPFYCFRKFLSYCKLESSMLNIFMDAFYGCYRTESTYYRLFAAVYILFRIVNLLLLSIVKGTIYFSCAGYAFALVMMVVAVVRPYQKRWHNFVDVMLLLSVVTFSFYINLDILYITSPGHLLPDFVRLLIFLLIMLFPCVYGFSVLMWHVMPKCCVNRLRVMFTRGLHRELEESLPHRLQQNNEYSSLIQ